jgi:hypothetical protein
MRTHLIIATIATSLAASPAFSQCRSYTEFTEDDIESPVIHLTDKGASVSLEWGDTELTCVGGVCSGENPVAGEVSFAITKEDPGEYAIINRKRWKAFCWDN